MQCWAIFKLKVYVLRILLVNYRYFVSGGPERYMFNVKELLEQAGHDVVPFSIKSRKNIHSGYEEYFAEPLGGQDEAYFDNAHVTPRFAWDVLARLFYSFTVRKQLEKLIDDTKPDVAYILHHYNKLSPSVIDACKNKGLKVYVRLSDFFLLCPEAHFLRNGMPCEKCLDKGLYAAVLGRCVKKSFVGSFLKSTALFIHRNVLSCYRRVDGFICTTQFMKLKMQKGGWPEQKLNVVPTFMRIPENKESDYKSTEIIGNKYILFFGRFSHEKGVDLLFDAFSKSNMPSKNIDLLLVGGTSEQLGKLVGSSFNSSLVGKHIRILDFLPHEQLANIIRDAMFVVVPSRCYENLPNSVLEAYSHGKAVVAMNIGSMPEIVEDGVYGLLFKRDDSDDLKDKLERLSNDPSYLTALSKNTIKNIEKYNSKLHLENLIKLLK